MVVALIILILVARLVLIDDDGLARTWLVHLHVLLLVGGLHLTRLARSADHHIHANATAEEQGQPHADLPENKHAVVAARCGVGIVATRAGSFLFCIGVVIICGTIAHYLRNYKFLNRIN